MNVATINERGTRNFRMLGGNQRPELVSAQAATLLNLRRLPGRLTAAQTAVMLNCADHDIPALMRAGMLKPLGNPLPNSVKHFGTVEILDLANDKSSMEAISETLASYWKKKNAIRKPRDLT